MTGQELRKRRRAAGLTGGELAAQLHITALHLWRLERGESAITGSMAELIRRVLDEVKK